MFILATKAMYENINPKLAIIEMSNKQYSMILVILTKKLSKIKIKKIKLLNGDVSVTINEWEGYNNLEYLILNIRRCDVLIQNFENVRL